MPKWGLFQWLNRTRQAAREKRLRELLVQKGLLPERIDFLIWCATYSWLDDEDRDWLAEGSGFSRAELDARMNSGFMMMFQDKHVAELVLGDKQKAEHAHLAALQWRVSLSQGRPDDP